MTLSERYLWCHQKGRRTDISVTEDLVEKLFNVTEFKNFFEGGKRGDERWYAFCNQIQSNPDDFMLLAQKLKLLAK
jgi:hypothetical protein